MPAAGVRSVEGQFCVCYAHYILKSRCFTLDAFVRNSLTDLLACVEDIPRVQTIIRRRRETRAEAMRADAESGVRPSVAMTPTMPFGSAQNRCESRGSQAMAEDAIVDVLRQSNKLTSESLRRFARDVEVLSFSDPRYHFSWCCRRCILYRGRRGR